MRVLITGSTSGLGREMAIQLAREHASLALTGRRLEKLNEIAEEIKNKGGQVIVLPGDVSDLDNVKSSYQKIKEQWGGLDWAILNAGVSGRTDFKNFNLEIFNQIYETNVKGTMNWMSMVLPDMIAQKSGTIGIISSIAGFRGLPESGSYSSSKAALINLAESARLDLRGTGVSVVTVCPGYVKSEMTAVHDQKKMLFLLETDDGAKRILDGMKAKKRLVHFPKPLSLPLKILELLPGFMYEGFISLMMKRFNPHPKD